MTTPLETRFKITIQKEGPGEASTSKRSQLLGTRTIAGYIQNVITDFALHNHNFKYYLQCDFTAGVKKQ